ncbi:MAG: VanW family protein [Clostridiales bacterium]|nr:VanW family protein [Clostridiales bacterium]
MGKPILAAVLAAVLIMSLLACGRESLDALAEDTSESVSTTEETTEETTTELTTNEPTVIAPTRVVYPVLEKDTGSSFTYEMASYTTKYDASLKGRTTTLELASAAITATVLQPGEIFSFNQVVGKRTEARGYQSGTVVINGQFEDGLGGGICQVSSTLFNAVLQANLTIVERTNHSVRIAYVPAGYDATVQWNTKDFQFKNNYDFPIKLNMVLNKGQLTATIYCEEEVELPDITFSLANENGTYTLKRLANGEVNYTTKSNYQAAGT